MAKQDQAMIARLVQALSGRHGDETRYTSCPTNCGGQGQCVLKARVKNGRVVAIEPDDHYNVGIGREDRVLSALDLARGKVQRRACPAGWTWHRHLHDSDRLLYPLLRKRGTARGEGIFERISWDAALDLIAQKLSDAKDDFGPYSILVAGWSPNAERLLGFLQAGVISWGGCSCDSERLMSQLTAGRRIEESYGSSSTGDLMLNAKLVVLFGFDPTTTHYGPGHQFAWYVKMAREQGTPIICIDPRYTMTAEVLADQWIPIKPGTDMAFMTAVAYVLFRERLWNEEFVRRVVEPTGFDRWRRYVLGAEDGEAKSPVWAEAICGVPAETIVEFARLYARSKPTWLWKNWAVARKSRGENSTRAAAMLQAMMGYFGVPGGILPYFLGAWQLPRLGVPLGDAPLGYTVPQAFRAFMWAQAVLLLDDVRAGRMTRDEWRSRVGYMAPKELPLPEEFRPRVSLWGSYSQTGINHLSTTCDSTNDQIRALQWLDFVVQMHTSMTPTVKFADLVLPAIDHMWEYLGITQQQTSAGGFSIMGCNPVVVSPPGETRSLEWVYTKIAYRLGFGPEYNRYYTTDENWDRDWTRYQKECYEVRSSKLDFEAPTWDQFRAGKFVFVDEHRDGPYVGYTEEVAEGKGFHTKSGKFEIFSDLLADESQRGQMHFDHLGRWIDSLPNDWRDLQPLPVYQPTAFGLDSPLTAKYPLMMLTPHGRYRAHSMFWTVPWLRGDVYRHAVWLSVADANARGIADGDRVRIFNERGHIFLPAYVTSRIMPGVTVVRAGAWYSPEDGVSAQVLLGDSDGPLTPAPATTLVEAEKAER